MTDAPNPPDAVHRRAARAPVDAIVLAVSLLAVGWAAARVIHAYGLPVDWKEVSVEMSLWFVSLSCLALCALGSYLAVRPLWFRIVLVIKCGFLAAYLVSAPPGLDTELPITCAVMMEIGIRERFSANLILDALLVLACIPLRAANPALARAVGGDRLMGVFLPQVGFSLCAMAVAVPWCLLPHYRQVTLVQRDNLARLDNAVSELSKANLGYQHYASEAANRSQREERLRITRELHDVIGYTFTNNIMMLEAAISKISKDPRRVEELIELARENAKTGLEKIRHSLHLLRSSEPPRMTSIQRIHKLILVFGIATGVEVRTEYSDAPDEMGQEREEFFFYFVQEALTNAFRHGQATRIRIYFARANGTLFASVLDNGHGAGSIVEGIGIAGMRERLAKLDGTLRIVDSPQGFEIVGEVPYDREGAHG
jgi:signal transduction histidine kinase